jgi:hypothetical protein
MIHMFRSINFENDLSSLGLLTEFKSKIPESMRESWGRYVNQRGGLPSVSLFHAWLSEKDEAIPAGCVTVTAER